MGGAVNLLQQLLPIAYVFSNVVLRLLSVLANTFAKYSKRQNTILSDTFSHEINFSGFGFLVVQSALTVPVALSGPGRMASCKS